MKVFLLSEKNAVPVQAIVSISDTEHIMLTNDETFLVEQDLGDLSEKLMQASGSVFSSLIRRARGEVSRALNDVLYRELHLPALTILADPDVCS